MTWLARCWAGCTRATEPATCSRRQRLGPALTHEEGKGFHTPGNRVSGAQSTWTKCPDPGRPKALPGRRLSWGTRSWRGAACSPHLGPPTGEHEVGVHVLLPELLGHVEPQRAVLVVDVSFCGVRQDGVGVVDLLKLVCSLWVIRVLVRVIFQGKFPANQNHFFVPHSTFICEREGPVQEALLHHMSFPNSAQSSRMSESEEPSAAVSGQTWL